VVEVMRGDELSEEVATGQALLQLIMSLLSDSRRITRSAEMRGEFVPAIAGVKTSAGVVELLMSAVEKVGGSGAFQVDDAEFQRVQAVILDVLADEPALRAEIAERLSAGA